MTEQHPGRAGQPAEPTSGRPAAPVAGKRAGARRAAPPPRPRARSRRAVLGYAAGVTLAVVAWGYLVWAAIDFGATARDGDGRAWFFLALAALGAVACLFAGLMLVARLARALGLVGPPATGPEGPGGPDGAAGPGAPAGTAPRHGGGRRAAR